MSADILLVWPWRILIDLTLSWIFLDLPQYYLFVNHSNINSNSNHIKDILSSLNIFFSVIIVPMSTLYTTNASPRFFALFLLHVDWLTNVYLLEHCHSHICSNSKALLTYSVFHTLWSVLEFIFFDLLHSWGFWMVWASLSLAFRERMTDLSLCLLLAITTLYQFDVKSLWFIFIELLRWSCLWKLGRWDRFGSHYWNLKFMLFHHIIS